jgi:hypothetical protein
MKRLMFFLAAVLVLGRAATSDGQGVRTGTIRGTVKDPQDLVTNLNGNNINAYPLAFNAATPGGRTFRMAFGFRF